MIDYVQIGCIRYKVVMAERLDETDNTKWQLGEINYGDALIYLADNQDAQVMIATLWHEIIHGILDYSGHHESRDDEGLVDALAFGLMALVKQNPHLLRLTLKGGSQ